MSRYVVGWAAAGVLALASVVGAQSSGQTSGTAGQSGQQSGTTAGQQTGAAKQEGATARGGMVTVEGCLKREAEVPGRKPNVAERAGMGEDYILTNTKMIKGSAPAGRTTSAAKPGDAPTGTTGAAGAAAGAMYEVEGIDDEQLKKHVGHRVQIDGTFENVDQARDRKEAGTPADDLVELRGTTLRHIAGECK